MRYYLGLALNKSPYVDYMLEHGGTGNVLFSYASEQNADKAIEVLKKFSNFNVIIDSGAFSVWNSGKVMDRDKLFAYYKRLKEFRGDLTFITLDKIPGVRNRKPTLDEVDEACEMSWGNYLWFKKNGIQTIPVFHEGDDFKYLDLMMNETDFLAISPANDSSMKRRMVWLDKVYSILKANYKTHGLASTADTLLKRYPFYSVDSVNWLTPFMYGQSATRDDLEQRYMSKLSKANKRSVSMVEFDNHIKIQSEMTKLWSKRGVEW